MCFIKSLILLSRKQLPFCRSRRHIANACAAHLACDIHRFVYVTHDFFAVPFFLLPRFVPFFAWTRQVVEFYRWFYRGDLRRVKRNATGDFRGVSPTPWWSNPLVYDRSDTTMLLDYLTLSMTRRDRRVINSVQCRTWSIIRDLVASGLMVSRKCGWLAIWIKINLGSYVI